MNKMKSIDDATYSVRGLEDSNFHPLFTEGVELVFSNAQSCFIQAAKREEKIDAKAFYEQSFGFDKPKANKLKSAVSETLEQHNNVTVVANMNSAASLLESLIAKGFREVKA